MNKDDEKFIRKNFENALTQLMGQFVLSVAIQTKTSPKEINNIILDELLKKHKEFYPEIDFDKDNILVLGLNYPIQNTGDNK